VGCLHSSALALNNEEVFSQFQFNFITPGARAMAMGGAFIGLADDATATASNPAGLTVLTVPEFTTEFKYFGYTSEYIYENRSFETDITRKEFDNSVLSVPFVSAVFPYKRFVFFLYRQEVVNYKSSYRTGAYPILVPGTDLGIHPIDASADLTVTNYGIGVAVKLFEGLSLAVSPGWSEMKMNSYSAHFNPYPFDFSTPTNFSRDSVDLFFENRIEDDDRGFSINAGVLWNPHPKLTIGAVYRSRTEFTVTGMYGQVERYEWWSSILHPGRGGFTANWLSDFPEFTLNIPESFGIGIAFRATDFLTFTLDVVHIQYEDLLENFDVLLDLETVTYDEHPWEIDIVNGDVGNVRRIDVLLHPETITKENFTINNATEIHFGVEYISPLGKRLLALRAGVYNEPDHSIRFTGTTTDPMNEIAEKEKFPGGDNWIHFTGGVGLILNEQFQIDMATNIADRNTQFSVSATYRFGGTKAQGTKPLLSRTSSPKPVEKVPPSITFVVVMSEGTQGKTLEIRKIHTDTHDIRDFKVTTKKVGTTEFIVTASLEREHKRFTADIRIDIGQNKMTIEEIDTLGQVMIMKEKPDSLEFMIKFIGG
jgi:long-chain fatty acid transport protein